MEGAGVGPHWVERATSPQIPDWTGWLGPPRLMDLLHPVAHELTALRDPSTQRGPTPAPFEPSSAARSERECGIEEELESAGRIGRRMTGRRGERFGRANWNVSDVGGASSLTKSSMSPLVRRLIPRSGCMDGSTRRRSISVLGGRPRSTVPKGAGVGPRWVAGSRCAVNSCTTGRKSSIRRGGPSHPRPIRSLWRGCPATQ
jgi:hypothetical protein